MPVKAERCHRVTDAHFSSDTAWFDCVTVLIYFFLYFSLCACSDWLPSSLRRFETEMFMISRLFLLIDFCDFWEEMSHFDAIYLIFSHSFGI